jgi:molecular chaperone GrpE
MTNEDRIPESAFGGSEDADEVDAPHDIGEGDASAVEDSTPAPEAAAADGDVEDVDREPRSPLEVAVAQRDDYLEALRRLQAEFDNYRKRVIRQQTEHLDHATESLLERLLPVLDAFDLAIAHAATAGDDPSDLTAAFVRIEALLRDTLAKEGLDRIDAAGVAFDPTVHDAVAHVASDEAGPAAAAAVHGPVVDDVLRAGYRLKGRVLRPAMVRVRG